MNFIITTGALIVFMVHFVNGMTCSTGFLSYNAVKRKYIFFQNSICMRLFVIREGAVVSPASEETSAI